MKKEFKLADFEFIIYKKKKMSIIYSCMHPLKTRLLRARKN